LKKGEGAMKHPDLGLKALPPIELDILKRSDEEGVMTQNTEYYSTQ
jgi:hypothetical protein